MGRIQRIFNPTEAEQIEDLKWLSSLHIDQIGHCTTCKHYAGSEMPGFVTDYGICEKKSQMFIEKVCGLKRAECSMYEENTEELMVINQKIEYLIESGKRVDTDRK